MIVNPSTYMEVAVGNSSNTSATVSTFDGRPVGHEAQSASYMRALHEGTLDTGELAKFRSTLTQTIEYTADGSDIASTLSAVLSHQPGFVFTGSGTSETFFTKTAWAEFISANPDLADTPDTNAIQEAVYQPMQFGFGLDPSTWTNLVIKESAKTGISVTRYIGDVYQYLDGPESVYHLPSNSGGTYYYGELSFGAYDQGAFDSLDTYANKNADLTSEGGHPALHIGSQWPKVKLGSEEFTKADVTDGYLTLDFTGEKLQRILSDVLVDSGPTLAPDEVFRDRHFGHSISKHVGDEFNFTEFNPIFNLAVQTEVTIGRPKGWVVQPADITEDDQGNKVWNNSSGDASKALGSFYSYHLGFERNYSESNTGGISSREGLGEEFLKWSGDYTSSDTGTTTTSHSQVGIDLSFTKSLAHTSTTTCALRMSTDTVNLGLDWEVSGIKTSLDVAGVMIDLRMPVQPYDLVRRLVYGPLDSQDEAAEINFIGKKKEADLYVNKMRVDAALASIRAELSGVHTTLATGINEAENELGPLKTDVTIAQQFEAHTTRLEAETLKAELKLNENIARTNGNVMNMSKAKTAALMGAARMNEFHP